MIEDVAVHRAVPLLDAAGTGGAWVDGERDPGGERPRGTPFACALFLPVGTEERSPAGGREVRRPTLLYVTTDEAGEPVRLAASAELLVTAPELAVTEERFQLDGAPAPLGKPGEEVLGFQARLVRVSEGGGGG